MKDLIFRLRKRAEIRRSIQTRKSVLLGEPDRISDLLEEAADCIESLTCDSIKPTYEETHTCLEYPIYNQKHDANYCPRCDTWLEKVCDDINCSFCKDRPEKPSEAV